MHTSPDLVTGYGTGYGGLYTWAWQASRGRWCCTTSAGTGWRNSIRGVQISGGGPEGGRIPKALAAVLRSDEPVFVVVGREGVEPPQAMPTVYSPPRCHQLRISSCGSRVPAAIQPLPRRRVQGISWKSKAELSPATSYAVLPSKLLAMIALRQAIKLKLGSATPRMCLAASWA